MSDLNLDDDYEIEVLSKDGEIFGSSIVIANSKED
jgi:hypothetical protein